MAVCPLTLVLGALIAVVLVSAKPTIYVKNDNDKFEPALVAVSSTVIPLPVYKVSYGVGVGVQGSGPHPPRPTGLDTDYRLVTAPKKGNTKKVLPDLEGKKEEVKKHKLILF